MDSRKRHNCSPCFNGIKMRSCNTTWLSTPSGFCNLQRAGKSSVKREMAPTCHGHRGSIEAVKREDVLHIQPVVGALCGGPQAQPAADFCAGHIRVPHCCHQLLLLQSSFWLRQKYDQARWVNWYNHRSRKDHSAGTTVSLAGLLNGFHVNDTLNVARKA